MKKTRILPIALWLLFAAFVAMAVWIAGMDCSEFVAVMG